MNKDNKISLKRIMADNLQLPGVIKFSVSNPKHDKIFEVIKSYHNPDNKLMGAFMGDMLIGIIGLFETFRQITIQHISILPDFQRQKIGTLLLDNAKENFLIIPSLLKPMKNL